MPFSLSAFILKPTKMPKFFMPDLDTRQIALNHHFFNKNY